MESVRANAEAEHAISVSGMGDHPTAVSLYAAIVTALYRRQITGEGGEVNTSLLANGLWSNGCLVQAALCGVELPPRAARGKRNPLTDFYQTADGRTVMIVLINITREWPAFAKALGRSEWLEDSRFATHLTRLDNAEALSTLIREIIAAHPWSHWRERLGRAGIPFGLVGRITDHAEDAQLAANGLLPEFVDSPGLKTLDSPFQVRSEVKSAPRMAPSVGQHTRAVLDEFGLDLG
jgi:formyl-CoA transferase